MTCQIRKERKGNKWKEKARETNCSDTNQCQTYDKGDSHRKDGSEAEKKKGKLLRI
jgi:hypothetical protein